MAKKIGFVLVALVLALSAQAKQVRDLELPANSGDKVFRRAGFSFAYDFNHKVPKWVAYYLDKEKVTTADLERLDEFKTDAEVDKTVNTGDYTNSDYERGHMAAAEDMAWSKASQLDCFKMSNMTPQLKRLNGDFWKDLEKAVRNRTEADGEIYIATGPVLKDGLPKLVKNKKTKPVVTEVSIPEKFFKVLYQKKAGKPRALALVIPQDWDVKDFCKYSMSVDEAEKLTGLDFFPSLDDKTEKKVEAQNDCASWKLSTKKEK